MNGGRFRVLKMGVSAVFRAVSSREAIQSRNAGSACRRTSRLTEVEVAGHPVDEAFGVGSEQRCLLSEVLHLHAHGDGSSCAAANGLHGEQL